MTSIHIRSATHDDVNAILVLLEQLGYPLIPENMSNILTAYIETPLHKVFVAEIDSLIVGLLSMAGIHSFIYRGLTYRITSLIVDKEYRKRGVGKSLMIQAETFAKENYGKFMDLTSGMRRAKDGSHEFYKSLGFKNEGLMAKLYLRKDIS